MRPALLPCLLYLAVLLLAPAAVLAAPATYTGEAPVNSQSDEERSAALKTALANVVIAQTGDPGILARSDVASAVADAERYVVQYQYQHNAPETGGAPLTLVAQFDSAAVDAMLARLGVGSAASSVAAAPSEATLWIGGIRDADDFLRVMGYLERSNFVRTIQPTRALADGMLVKLSLATGLAGFLDAVAMERVLVQASVAPPLEGADAALVLVH